MMMSAMTSMGESNMIEVRRDQYRKESSTVMMREKILSLKSVSLIEINEMKITERTSSRNTKRKRSMKDLRESR